MARRLGYHRISAELVGEEYKPSLMDYFRHGWEHQIEFGDVVIATGVVIALGVTWEAIASKADLPRLGMFDSGMDVKLVAAKK